MDVHVTLRSSVDASLDVQLAASLAGGIQWALPQQQPIIRNKSRLAPHGTLFTSATFQTLDFKSLAGLAVGSGGCQEGSCV